MARRKPGDIVQINLRIRENLRNHIEASAKKRGHSLNREMERRLEQSFSNQQIEDIVSDAIAKVSEALVLPLDSKLNFIANQINLITSQLMKEKLND
jgi:hypothetical protein